MNKMIKLSIKVFFIGIVLIFLLQGVAETMCFSDHELLKIANKEAAHLGFNKQNSSHHVIDDSSPQVVIDYVKSLLQEPDVKRKLKKYDRDDYIIIHYALQEKPGEVLLGGALWIFIEKKTGKVLLDVKGK